MIVFHLLLPLLRLSIAETIKEEDPRIVHGQVRSSAMLSSYGERQTVLTRPTFWEQCAIEWSCGLLQNKEVTTWTQMWPKEDLDLFEAPLRLYDAIWESSLNSCLSGGSSRIFAVPGVRSAQLQQQTGKCKHTLYMHICIMQPPNALYHPSKDKALKVLLILLTDESIGTPTGHCVL